MKYFVSSIVAIAGQKLPGRRFSGAARLALMAGAALLSGCTSLPGPNLTQHSQDETQLAHEAAQTALAVDSAGAASATGAPAAGDNLPAVALTEELLYKLLTSEIAFQRGNWQAAYITILGVAQQTRDPRLARRAAEIALSAKQSGEALAAIRLWHELAPDSNEATQYYLGFMIMNNNLAEVQHILSERLAKAPPGEYGVIMLQAQRLLSRARDKKAAFDILEEILSPYKATTEAHLALAQGAYVSGDSTRAISEARAALLIKPDSSLAILTIAQASAKGDALKALEAFLETNPSIRDVRLAYASMLIDTRQLDKARHEFELLLHEKPDDAGTLYTLGALALESKQFKLAEKYFLAYLSALEAHPAEERDPTPALVNLAQIALEQKDKQAAMNWLSKVESYDGKNTAWLNIQMRRAQLMAMDGKLKEARAFLNAVKTNNQSEQIQLIQAEMQLLRNARQEQQAWELMQTAVERFPENPDLLYDYAMLAESQKKLTEMETILKRVIELAPNSQHAYNALGYSYADRNIHLDTALNLIEKALQLAPDDPFILDSLGWVKFRLALPEEAELALRRAYQLRPDPEIAIHLGEVLWSTGKKEDARRFWEEAKAKDPDNESLKDTLLRLNAKP